MKRILLSFFAIILVTPALLAPAFSQTEQEYNRMQDDARLKQFEKERQQRKEEKEAKKQAKLKQIEDQQNRQKLGLPPTATVTDPQQHATLKTSLVDQQVAASDCRKSSMVMLAAHSCFHVMTARA